MKSFSQWREEKIEEQIASQVDIDSLATTMNKYFNLPVGSNWTQIAQNLLNHVPGFDAAYSQAKAQQQQTKTTTTPTTPTGPAGPTTSPR